MKTHDNWRTGTLVLMALGLILGGAARRGARAVEEGLPGGGSETRAEIDDPDPMAGGVGYPVVYEPGNPNHFSPATQVWSDGTNLGIGTTAPQYPLDVTGDVRGSGRVAFGNDAIIGSDGVWERHFDFSQTITDFSASQNWNPFWSEVVFDPATDLTGPNETFLTSHFFTSETPPTNTRNLHDLEGPFMGAYHWGSGMLDYLVGASIVAQNRGDVGFQAGCGIFSVADAGGTTTANMGLSIYTGTQGAGSSITNDRTVQIYTPSTDGPITNHYGIYMEDQDVGTNDSYAIYSAGGMNYLAGDLGIGTTKPQSALHVNGAIRLEAMPEPATPTTGFVLYVDQADGGLKAKSSGGTVTALAAY